jgi:septal ring factor EnvC (AmiA/AmiB activator)
MRGIQIAARTEARVSSPCDGWVVYAGPFRSYGKLLIINGGGGYHIVLAGMDRLDVELGQFVLAGEPVGAMGSKRVAAAALGPVASTAGLADLASTLPVLYVEFRKENSSIDPAPWWVQSRDEKVRG